MHIYTKFAHQIDQFIVIPNTEIMDFYTTGSNDGFEYIKVWDAGGT